MTKQRRHDRGGFPQLDINFGQERAPDDGGELVRYRALLGNYAGSELRHGALLLATELVDDLMRGLARGFGRVVVQAGNVGEGPSRGGARLGVRRRLEIRQVEFGAGLVIRNTVLGHYLFFDFLDGGVVEAAAGEQRAVDQAGALFFEPIGDFARLALGLFFLTGLGELGAQILDLLITWQLIAGRHFFYLLEERSPGFFIAR